jgi:hypothetical protein
VDGEERENLIKEYTDAVNDRWRRVPTPYEDGGWYAVMEDLSEAIGQSANEAEMVISRRPLLGTLPTGQINAMTVRVPGTDNT